MNKVILFGGTGKLGTKIAKELQRKNYIVTAVVRNKSKSDSLKPFVNDTLIADVTDRQVLKDICTGFDIVISSLGKSVSPNDKSKPGFMNIDLDANSNILMEAISSGIKKFVYVSAFGAEKSLHLNYFNSHHLFSEKLKKSGIDYSIVKPPAILSSFIDLIGMAKSGKLATIGDGDKKTNPIYEGDLAEICVDSIHLKNSIIEVGGKKIYTRKEINEIIQKKINPDKKVKKIPLGMVKFGLPFIKLFDKNAFDKFAFYTEVMQHDTVAPQKGETTLEKYLSDRLYL